MFETKNLSAIILQKSTLKLYKILICLIDYTL